MILKDIVENTEPLLLCKKRIDTTASQICHYSDLKADDKYVSQQVDNHSSY